MIAATQAVLQRAFMRLEALFNAAFGDRLNPLYHLGAISFWLFWLVAGSGLYLYAFFETGVAGAHASVEALTHRQWFAGGILRSVHRYASDALVVTMLIHMLRHFAFDRLRGFRWFSWVTGVALIWGVYVSGINGYMLPWDRLSQFVIVATFEWLDWLPGFGGTLVRNFLYPSSVNDRFFSLLAFMHIGLPLLLLLGMWIHVQRVPKAKTNPPWPIMFSVAATMLVLAIVRPAVSQGTVDFGVVPSALQLDWFYLLIFPLLYAWPLGQVWALVGAATLLLVALPWLAARRRSARAGEFRMAIEGTAAPVVVRAGETLLEAGLRQGLALPYECRNGGCGVCACAVLHGEVDLGPYQPSALSDADRAAGKALMCCATARSDLDIAVLGAADASRLPVRTWSARVESMERLSEDLIVLRLGLPGDERIEFRAGQYINILLSDGERRAFSFANAPHDNARIELHVRRIPGGRYTGHVFTTMQEGDTVDFEGPLGDFTLRESALPIVFVAGATGFAPVKSIVEDAFERRLTRPMSLYWGVRRRSDLYMADLCERWQREHANFVFVPVLSEPLTSDAWTGRTGLVHEALLADFPDMKGHELYVCGSVRMVEAAIPAFLAHGAEEDFCFSDAFLPSARRPTGDAAA
jgi:NAD(P)H-flavin reductase/ferredoxin/quinol-cytochrome oxidoreductase complex cytochrome b subunit